MHTTATYELYIQRRYTATEKEMNESAEFSYSRAELSTKLLHCKREPNRPNSYVAAVADNEIRLWVDAPQQQRGALILCLPKEIWLSILANYGLTANDLVAVEKACRWFSTCLQGKLACACMRCGSARPN